MAGPPRGAAKKTGLRSAAPSQTVAGPSSSATVLDETLNVVNGNRRNYQSPQDTQSSSDVPRLSQSLETPSVRSNGSTESTASSATTDVKLEPLGDGNRDVISMMDNLQKLGLSDLNIQLAKCVIVGDQSAGKSSVIEAISGVKVPRSGGTCTRCPMFVKLESSTDPESGWQATVTLRYMFTYAPDPRQKAQCDPNFPTWQKKPLPHEEVPFARTKDEHDLGNIIACAQLAILNPKLDAARFIPGSVKNILAIPRQADFSPNLVCISISAPGLPNLSFYDLPGVIISKGDPAKEKLKKVIDSLVLEYIGDDHALVLLTMALEGDWDTNSNAAVHLRQTRSTGRCVGVMTKPDRIDNDLRYVDIKKALEGKQDPLGHGYFVVKQPSQDELERGITNPEARAAEERFFDEEQPWAGDLAAHRERFGTRNLQVTLSRLLAGLSTQALPRIWKQISDQLATVESELAEIPEPPTHNAIGEVHKALRDFTEHLKKELCREETCQDWRLVWDRLRGQFAKKLLSLRPTLDQEGLQDKTLFNQGPETIDLCSDNEETPTQVAYIPATPKKRKLEQTSFTTPSRSSSAAVAMNGQRVKKPKKGIDPRARAYGLDHMRVRLYEGSYAKLAQHVNPKALEKLMLESLEHWGEEMQLFFAQLEKDMLAQCQRVLRHSLAKWSTAQLYEETERIVKKFLTFDLDNQRTTMGPDTLNAELSGTYMWQTGIFDGHKARYEEVYKSVRCKQREKVYWDLLDESMDADQREISAKKEPHKSILAATKDKELYSKEVDVIAQVRAYYELARIRFHDTICMRVEAHLFNQFSNDLFSHLSDDLGLESQNVYQRCIELLAEDPERQLRRQRLKLEKASLLAGWECVTNFKNKYTDAASFNMPGEASVTSNHADDDYDMLHDE